MPLFAEKRIIETVDSWIRKNKYEQTEEESKCLRSYSKSMLISGAATLSIFTFIGYKSLDFKALFGPSANRNIFQNLLVPLTAISGGAFITTYYVARNATTDCLQCLLNLESFNSALAKVTEDEVNKIHPNSKEFFKQFAPELYNKKYSSDDGKKTE